MTRPRDNLIGIESLNRDTWQGVVSIIGAVTSRSPASWFTKRYLRALRKLDSVNNRNALQYAAALQAHVYLATLKDDPRVVGYPIQKLMRNLFILSEFCGFPGSSEFGAIHQTARPLVLGTAYGTGWPVQPAGWRNDENPGDEPVVYRRIRRTTNDQPQEELGHSATRPAPDATGAGDNAGCAADNRGGDDGRLGAIPHPVG